MKYVYLFLSCLLFEIKFIHAQNLYFGYDNSGNQIIRKLKNDETRELIPGPLQSETIDPLPMGEPIMYTKNHEIEIYPNPVETELTIQWNAYIANLLVKIELSPYNSALIEEVKFQDSKQKAVLNMSHRPSGVYYIKVYCSDGRIISHTIIKK